MFSSWVLTVPSRATGWQCCGPRRRCSWVRKTRIANGSIDNSNNAWMTQLLGFGTGTVNFFGRYAYVGEGKDGLAAVVWTEQEEPQAALGSHLHRLAYPDHFKTHVEKNKAELKEAHHHHADE